jgi:cobyrinic acid a,c-diamide synthase
MQQLARVAIGTVQPGVDSEFVAWALMAAMQQAGLRVQHFVSRACFSPRDGAASITNQTTRHLDTWLLEPEGCRSLFQWGASGSDLALVDGHFRSALANAELHGGDLETLCDWLELPRIAIVDAARINGCQLPEPPQRLDGVLIENVSCSAQRCRMQTSLEALWGAPVLGFVADVPRLRAEVSALSSDASPSSILCEALASKALDGKTIERIVQLASAHESTWRARAIGQVMSSGKPLRVAMAYDDAFHCYFPDALDQLELLGAELLDFSPLRDDRLPPDVDLVYFGCGRPEMFAHQLAENCCIAAALKNHVTSGGRLYAECGGLAYLCQYIDLPDARRLPMSGVLPVAAELQPDMPSPAAVELTLSEECWLGGIGSNLRGYRNGRWQFKPLGSEVIELAPNTLSPCDAFAYHHAVGSRLHLNFAMQPTLLEHIFTPFESLPRAITVGRFV